MRKGRGRGVAVYDNWTAQSKKTVLGAGRCNSNGYTHKATTYAFFKEVDKKYTGCNLKTTELVDCALTGDVW